MMNDPFKLEFEFSLSKQGKHVGMIHWTFETDKKIGKLQGNQQALDLLQATIQKAIFEKWEIRYAQIHIQVSDPINHLPEMIAVLQQGGFDMPDVLYPHTPEARRAASQARRSQSSGMKIY